MNKRIFQTIQSLLCIAVVMVVAIITFLYRDSISLYASKGYWGLFLACVASTATILLPAPGILVVLQYAQLLNPLIVVIIGGMGTSIGELLGYLLGRKGNDILNIDSNNMVIRLFNRNPIIAVFIFSFLPLPLFDVVGICAGVSRMSPVKFWITCLFGKTLKMGAYVVAFLYITQLQRLIY